MKTPVRQLKYNRKLQIEVDQFFINELEKAVGFFLKQIDQIKMENATKAQAQYLERKKIKIIKQAALMCNK